MIEVYDLSNKVPVILSVLVIAAVFIKGFSNRLSDSLESGKGYRGIPGAVDYYTQGGHLVRLVRKGRTFRAYLAENLSLPDIRYDRYGLYIDTGCRTENDAEIYVDRLL